MLIHHLSFKDHSLNWELRNTELSRLTLLVGASGVGKTKILRSILSLSRIASGMAQDGTEWNVAFTVDGGKDYQWKGKFESHGIRYDIDDENDSSKRSKILTEELALNGRVIAKRNGLDFSFNKKQLPKLPPQQSLLNLLKEEELIKPAYEGLKRIIFSDQSESLREPYRVNLFDANKLAKKLKTIEAIRDSNERNKTKLYLCYVNQKKVFGQIRDRYVDIFPQVEDIKVEPLDVQEEGVPEFFKDLPFIQIKEKGVNKWVEQGVISSGMLRTLLHLSEIYLCKEGTVFLIDEFENSLGINCIDELTNDIVRSKRDIQFIITSHHPYIINNINPSSWKLVTRNASIVKTQDVSKFNFSKSRHDAFMQLLQLEEFQSGRA